MSLPFVLRRLCRVLTLIVVALGLGACSRAPQAVQFIAEGQPEHLSDWHLLVLDGHHVRLNAGVEPYELNTPLFSDYAHKLRTLWMPKGQAAHYDATKTFDFPVGTVISKTFYYPKAEGAVLRQTADTGAEWREGALSLSEVRLIETRLLVRRAEGWVALPYFWNEEQTEATLARTGEQAQLELQDEAGQHQRFTYVVPNQNQCASCHMTELKSRAIQPIGPKARHLNRDFVYANADADADGAVVSENQLVHLERVGYLSGVPRGESAGELPKAANWSDASQPLADRARAYLDINCAHCHNPSGPAANTALNLEPFLPMSSVLGLCKPPVAAGKGTGNRLFDIVPGRPDDSIMLYRLTSTEEGAMMPELGRSTTHHEGVALIRQWVASIHGECSPAQP